MIKFRKKKADKNIDKLILLLTKLSGKAYIDDGIKEMITTSLSMF